MTWRYERDARASRMKKLRQAAYQRQKTRHGLRGVLARQQAMVARARARAEFERVQFLAALDLIAKMHGLEPRPSKSVESAAPQIRLLSCPLTVACLDFAQRCGWRAMSCAMCDVYRTHRDADGLWTTSIVIDLANSRIE